MAMVKQVQLILIAALAAAIALTSIQARAAEADEPAITGVRVQLDNDLFAAGGRRDRDYTGGGAITISGRAARDTLLSLDPLLAKLDRVAGMRSEETYYARQFGLIAFTPGDVLAREALHADRPYASLLFTSNGRVNVDAGGRRAWSSSLTVGVLGLGLSESLHRGVHELIGSAAPQGYAHQISSGGEPTARYTLARHFHWIANPTNTFDVKTTLQGSIGFLTEASAAISLRLGRFSTPWWGFAPELTDYVAAPVPVRSGRSRPELYFFAGARVKTRAYNALLQGQFRDSDVHFSGSEVRPVIGEAWLGAVTQVFVQTQLSYTLNYQTGELRHGPAARDALWGGVQVTHSF